MIHTLTPHMSCVAEQHELDEALAQGFTKVYLVTPTGIFLHHKLQGENRFIRLKVDKIPNYELENPPAAPLSQAISFLPAGKIPYALFEQIVAFFKQVSAVKKSELEAMAWIMWNPERGYFIQIPEQTISKAAVSYDWSSVEAGSSLVVDIHSHNSMNAFFSGTDDGDDRNAINYSGVVGKLDQKEYATVWRFNYLNRKFEAKMADVFDEGNSVEVPEDWIEKVKTRQYVSPGYQGGHSYQGNVHGGSRAPQTSFPRNNPANAAGSSPSTALILPLTTGSNSKVQPGNRMGPGMQSRPEDRIRAGNEAAAELEWRARQQEILEESEAWDTSGFRGFFDPAGNQITPSTSEDDFQFPTSNFFGGSESSQPSDRALAAAEASIDRMRNGSLLDIAGYPAEDDSLTLSDSEEAELLIDLLNDEDGFTDDPRWNELVCSMGVEKAKLYLLIEHASKLFDGEDTMLNCLMTEYFQSMTPEGQAQMFREMFQMLPSEAQERVQANGL